MNQPLGIEVDRLDPTKPELLTSRITERFFRRVLTEFRPINSLTLVSPWISVWETDVTSLTSLRDAIDRRRIRTIILTRPPIEKWHGEALELLKTSAHDTVYFIPDLHAKIFVCEAVPLGFGIIGSANLTARSLTNYEVGVLFEGRGTFSVLLRELRLFAQDLRRLAVDRHPRIRR